MTSIIHKLASLPTHTKLLLGVATFVLLGELLLRRLAPQSRTYARWTGAFQGVGSVWTAVLLSIIYVLSVGPIGIGMRLFGKDPLDRGLRPEPTLWRLHEPNPLGPKAAATHQF